MAGALCNRRVWARWLLATTVTGPVYEELLFRGFLLPSLALWLPPWAAVAPSAVRTGFITGGTGGQGAGTTTPLLDLDADGRALPLQRVVEGDDVVGADLFLLGPGSRYMNW